MRDELAAGSERPATPAEPTVAAIVDAYLADRRGHVSDIERLENAAKAIKRHVGTLRPEHLAKRLYWQRRAKDGVGDGTVLKECVTLRSALRLAAKERWITVAPHIDAPPKPAPRDRWLTREEAATLLSNCATPHVRLFATLAIHTAGRKTAITRLRWSQVDFDRRLIDLAEPGRRETRKRRAKVPMTPDLFAALQSARLVATTEHVIEFRGKPVASVRHAFERAVERSGLSWLTPHDLRRTAASWMAQAGVPLEEVAAFLGDSIDMVRKVYAHFAPDYLRRAADAIQGVSLTVVGSIPTNPAFSDTKRTASARKT